jgi:hypothetical protein
MIVSSTATAQVVNNSIHQRLELLPDRGIHSTTAGSTVEWSCISRSLTSKCLVYHNDQWFSFVAEKSGTWFLNISSQQCRDDKGVQMIVIEGNPCEISTYRILQCIPQVRGEDVYIKLDSLTAGITYLVNVDGFLGDFCEFDLTLSDRPDGLPQSSPAGEGSKLQVIRNHHLVDITWTVERMTGSLNAFRVYRRQGNNRAYEVAEVSPLHNALGTRTTNYSVRDTLGNYGQYYYEVFEISSNGEATLVGSKVVRYAEPFRIAPSAPVTYRASLPLTLTEGAAFRVVAYDRAKGEKLMSWSARYNAAKHALFEIDFREWVESGVREFQVLVIEDEQPEPGEYYFRWNNVSGVVRE